MKFLVDNTDQENDYAVSNITEDYQRNDEENDVEEETGVESVGWRSLNPVKKKTREYVNTDQKKVMDSLKVGLSPSEKKIICCHESP